MTTLSPPLAGNEPRNPLFDLVFQALRSPSVLIGGILVAVIVFMAVAAPLLGTVDSIRINPGMRLKPPSELAWFGTDLFGRDVYSRAIYGARSSLLVGLSVAAFSIVFGVLIGLFAGYFRSADIVVMRIMDGLMAIPNLISVLISIPLLRRLHREFFDARAASRRGVTT
jgi:peptide/nickel transport system permease protein